MSKALVTGGTGFIGSHLVDRLMQEGFDVVVLDNLSSGDINNVRAHLESSRLSFIKGDVRDKATVRKALKDVEYVFHLAAIASIDLSIKRPDLVDSVNVLGTVVVLQESVKNNVSRFVYASSCAVYGEPEQLPVNEEQAAKPLSPYGASKLAGEHYCLAFHRAYGLDVLVLRIFNVYGPRQERSPYGGLVSKVVERLRRGVPPIIFGDGRQTRDFIYVSDVVEAMMLSLKGKSCAGSVINIGSGVEVSVREVVDKLIQIFGLKIKPIHTKPRAGDVRRMCADVRKAKELLGFEAKVSLDEGLEKYVKSVLGC